MQPRDGDSLNDPLLSEALRKPEQNAQRELEAAVLRVVASYPHQAAAQEAHGP